MIDDLIEYLDNTDMVNVEYDDEYSPYKYVSVEEWINDSFYTGNITVWDYWKDKFIEFYKSGKNELILTGSTRSGKNFFTNLIIMRELYELSYMKYKYGSCLYRFPYLNKTSVLNILILSVSIKQAEKTCFIELRNMIDESEYFRKYFPRNIKNNSSIIFDNGKIIISVATSFITSVVGMNSYIVVLDEANIIGGGDFNLAQNLYVETMSRRIQTFKDKDNKVYGFNVLISSAGTHESFIEKRIVEGLKYNTSFVVRTRKYDLQPGMFSSKKFVIFIGDKDLDPFVVNETTFDKFKDILKYYGVEKYDYEYVDESSVIVPEELLNKFEYVPIDFYNSAVVDVTRVLRDVCGISLGVCGNFFNNMVKYMECIDNTLSHPFYKDAIEVSTENVLLSDNELINLLKDDFKADKLYDTEYCIGLDLSKINDSTGISMSCYYNGKYIVVMMLKILPPVNPEHRIRYRSIRDFIDYLINVRKFRIKYIYVDSYQSEEFIQYYKEKGIVCETLGIDKNDSKYIVFRNLILENKILYYNYEYFKNELLELIHDRVKKKVDHVEGGSKDVVDAVCRSVIGLYNRCDILESVYSNGVIGYIKKIMNDNMTREGVLRYEHLNNREDIRVKYEKERIKNLIFKKKF